MHLSLIKALIELWTIDLTNLAVEDLPAQLLLGVHFPLVALIVLSVQLSLPAYAAAAETLPTLLSVVVAVILTCLFPVQLEQQP